MNQVPTIKLGKTEYVILPKTDYLKLRDGAGIPAGVSTPSRTHVPHRLDVESRSRARAPHASRPCQINRQKPITGLRRESGTISLAPARLGRPQNLRTPQDWTGPGQGGGGSGARVPQSPRGSRKRTVARPELHRTRHRVIGISSAASSDRPAPGPSNPAGVRKF